MERSVERVRKFLENLPDYQGFLTLEELDASSRELAEKYPDLVEVFSIGKTREGRDILCQKIGKGSKNVLFYGLPHPNEPIGTMLLEYLSHELVKRPDYLEEMDFTWYLVKAWDADGLVRNHGWLKGPFTVTNYAKHFYRPAMKEQVDWTFPVDYKELHFHDVLPETEAMMKLIDEIQPVFSYSLHNAGFGGIYWYVTEDRPQIYGPMRDIVASQELPLHLGDPESPFLKEMAPAVYLAEGIWETYDYMEENGVENIGAILGGTCSDDYSKTKYGTFTMLTELPYFRDPRIEDQSLTERTKREIALERLEKTEESNAELRGYLKKLESGLSKDNTYVTAILDFTIDEHVQAEKEDVLTNPKYEEKATVAEVFDNSLIRDFYHLLNYGMLVRAIEEDGLEESEKSIYEEAKRIFEKRANTLEEELDYAPIPIKKLVYIQLGCGLVLAETFR